MKRFLIYHLACWMSAVLLLLAVRPAVAQTVDWVADIGRGQSGWSVTQVVADAPGNTFVCGAFHDSLRLGAFTLRNVDTTRLGRGDGFVARFDASGTCQWVAHISGQNGESAQAIALDPAGNVLVTGSYWSYDAHFGPITLYNASAYADLFVAKLDGATGQWLWARRMGGTGNDGGTLLKTDAAGDVYVAGTFASDTLRTGGTPAFLVNQHYRANILTETVIAKFSDGTGQCGWAARAGVDMAASLTLDDRGHVLVSGPFDYASADIGSTVLTTYSAGSGTSYVVNNQFILPASMPPRASGSGPRRVATATSSTGEPLPASSTLTVKASLPSSDLWRGLRRSPSARQRFIITATTTQSRSVCYPMASWPASTAAASGSALSV